ncbi:MAG: tetratricopeptide (TPR) repeat protein [bacterium]
MDRFDLGSHTKRISTSSTEAQKYFNIGLNWSYGFNQEEGVACFKQALMHDSECIMAHWGVAYAAGPFYNNLWRQHSLDEANTITLLCHNSVQLAKLCYQNATPLEIQLVEALSCRFQKPYAVTGEEFDRWDDDYANAMRRVYYNFKDDHDAAALFAEALMTRTAWNLWNVSTGEPTEGADTLEALEVIERSIAMNTAAGKQQHLSILHLHIHVTEMSNEPERARESANVLSTLCPDAGHLNHMPGHTYVLCGEYELAKIASEKAIRADNVYVDYAGPYNFYTTARAHDLHLMMFTCMFLGQYAPALKAAESICQTITKELLSIQGRPQMVTTLEGYYSMRMHILVRFGRWKEIVDEPIPDDATLYPVTIAMHHYAKGVAYAFLKNIEAAEDQRESFYKAVAAIPEERIFFNNPALEILAVGEAMLEGELAYHKGEFVRAFDQLRESVKRNDSLHYSEPWPWMHPPRHALAALLAEQGHYEEAEDVYRTDLGLNDKLQRCAQHPNNVWALHGLVECLEHRNETVELPLLKQKLSHAQSMTDVSITSSCLCRSDTAVQKSCC